MRNLKSMYCEKKYDEIDHYKNFGNPKNFFWEKCYLIKVPKTSGRFVIENFDSTHFSKNVGQDDGQLSCFMKFFVA